MHLARFDGRRWIYSIALIDTLFIWISFQLGLVGAIAYMGISTIQLFKAPWNVSILWLTILGVFSWIFLILAPMAKFPIGLPTKVWGHVQQALFYKRNPVYYGLLTILWIFVVWRTLLPWLFAGTWLGQIAAFNT